MSDHKWTKGFFAYVLGQAKALYIGVVSNTHVSTHWKKASVPCLFSMQRTQDTGVFVPGGVR